MANIALAESVESTGTKPSLKIAVEGCYVGHNLWRARESVPQA